MGQSDVENKERQIDREKEPLDNMKRQRRMGGRDWVELSERCPERWGQDDKMPSVILISAKSDGLTAVMYGIRMVCRCCHFSQVHHTVLFLYHVMCLAFLHTSKIHFVPISLYSRFTVVHSLSRSLLKSGKLTVTECSTCKKLLFQNSCLD